MQHGIIINRQGTRTHVAVLEEGRPKEFFCEQDLRPGALGNIFVGRVVRLVAGLQAAFVDIGQKRNAFLYAADLLPQLALHGQPHTQQAAALPEIHTLVSAGTRLLVQVRKEGVGDKGPRVTSHIALTGRYVVLLPHARHVAISQRITDEPTRKLLHERLEPLCSLLGGIVVRTAAKSVDGAMLEQEARALHHRWRGIEQALAAKKSPRLVHSEPAAALRVLRELYEPSMEHILVNDAALHQAIVQEMATIAPHRAHTVQQWQPAPFGLHGLVQGDVWRSHKLHSIRAKALKSRVELPHGGFLLIEQTAALTVIDVNSGTFSGHKTFEKTMVALNTAAAVAIAEQLRLRNIGGIVVIDFVDLNTAKGVATVEAALAQAMRPDRAKHHLLPMNALGLVALTRRRLRPSLQECATEPCRSCRGCGHTHLAEEVAEAALSLLSMLAAEGSLTATLLQVHADVANTLQTSLGESLAMLEVNLNLLVFVVPVTTMHRSRFEILSLDEPGHLTAVDLRD